MRNEEYYSKVNVTKFRFLMRCSDNFCSFFHCATDAFSFSVLIILFSFISFVSRFDDRNEFSSAI